MIRIAVSGFLNTPGARGDESVESVDTRCFARLFFFQWSYGVVS